MTLRQPRDGTTLLEFFRQLMSGAEVLDGRMITCSVTSTGGTVQSFSHGLGRVYRGAAVVGTSGFTTQTVTAAVPDDVAYPEAQFALVLSAALNGTVKVWIF